MKCIYYFAGLELHLNIDLYLPIPMKYLLLFCSLLLSTGSFAQTTNGADERSVFEIRKEGGNKYFKVLEELKNYNSEDAIQQATSKVVMINYASFLAPNIHFDSLAKQVRPRFRADSIGDTIRQQGIMGLTSVKKKMASLIADENLVMINEHHYFPHHRILVDELLPLFAEAGYTYFALEALSPESDSLLNLGKPPTVDSGFYTKDPRFANILRTAQGLGFTFVAYENTDRNMDREEGQAANIYNATFAQDPDAKVLVFAGMAHILEEPTSRGKTWMANILRENYELDPLTFDQYHLIHFRNLTEDVSLVNSSAFTNPLLQSVDYHLINNLSVTDPNPTYTYQNTHGQPVQVSLFLSSEKTGSLTYNDLIPYRSGLLAPGETIEYRLSQEKFYRIVYDKLGNILEEGPVKL